MATTSIRISEHAVWRWQQRVNERADAAQARDEIREVLEHGRAEAHLLGLARVVEVALAAVGRRRFGAGVLSALHHRSR